VRLTALCLAIATFAESQRCSPDGTMAHEVLRPKCRRRGERSPAAEPHTTLTPMTRDRACMEAIPSLAMTVGRKENPLSLPSGMIAAGDLSAPCIPAAPRVPGGR
jgi:hypothetical protein